MKPLVLALAFLTAGSIVGQNAPATPAAGEEQPPARNEVIRKLSRRERRERISKLEVRHQDFVADVEPIIIPAELDTFLMLETDAQRDSFVDDFWRRRDIAHSVRSFKDSYYERLGVAKEQFRRIGSDRARMFLLYGPPSQVSRSECASLLQPIEVWRYPVLPALGQDVRVLFYRPRSGTDYILWNPVGGATAMADLLSQGMGADDPRRNTPQSQSPYAYISRIQLECRDGDQIMRAITQMIQMRIDLMRLFEPPKLDDEGVRKILRSLVIANPEAKKLNAEWRVAYPAKEGSRTDVQMTVLVPRAELTPAESGGVEVYTLDVTGEILRDGKLWEKYRYRFDYPGDVESEKLPVVIDRFLRPNEYVSRVKVVDATTGAEVVLEHPIVVPEIFTPAAVVAEEPHTTEPVPASVGVVAAKKDGQPEEPRLRLVPPAEEIVSGLTTVQTVASGDRIKAVEFWLDGRKIALRRAQPFSLDIDFGVVPQMRRIRAVALDAAGTPLTGDEIIVNGGTDPFRVRIVSPRVAPRLHGAARVEVDVKVPEGDELGALELYWNETRVATLFDPPFVQTVNIPSTEGVGYLRAVARLKDDSVPPIEDVVLINTPAYMETMDVHLVELPTTALVNNRPRGDLPEGAFKVFDEGKQVKLSKFEYVKNLPLSLGIAFDTSGSMSPKLDEAQKAGAQFVDKVMKRGDKAFLVAFSEEPRIVQPWSSRIADMHAGLARMRAEETTALYDAIVYSLYNFHRVRGQKALVVISDGKDTASKFSFDEALEYARRAGVPIYAIGIAIRGNEIDVRYKLARFCAETGGTVYHIDEARELQKVYDEIQTELRSQYILGFYPSPDVKPGGKWREVEVQVEGGKARTVRGYFP
jgi:Ca-activated chloride channel family protein